MRPPLAASPLRAPPLSPGPAQGPPYRGLQRRWRSPQGQLSTLGCWGTRFERKAEPSVERGPCPPRWPVALCRMTLVWILSCGLFLEPPLLPSASPPSSPSPASSLYSDHPPTFSTSKQQAIERPPDLSPSPLFSLRPAPQAWLPAELKAHWDVSLAGGCSSSA